MIHAYEDEDNAPMSESMLPSEKNCHERCPYSKTCYEWFHYKGCHDPNYPWECPMYDKIMDHMMEAKDMPFYDPDNDLPEEGEDDGTDT